MADPGRRTWAAALPILACLAAGSLYGWSGYLPSVRDAFMSSNAEGSMVFSIAIASFTLGVLFGPPVLGRVRLRFRLAAISGTASACLLCAFASPSLTVFLLAYGIGFGLASGAIYNHALAVAAQSTSAAWLMPISVASFGLGGAVFGPLTVWLGRHGWGLWSQAPAACLLALVAIVALASMGTAPAPSRRSVSETDPLPAFVPPIGSTAVLWAIFACGSVSGLVILGFSAQILLERSGGSGSAGLPILLVAVGNTLGRLLAAPLSICLNPYRVIGSALALSCLAVSGLILLEGQMPTVALLFAVALNYGLVAAGMPLLLKTRLGRDAFASAFGRVFTGWGLAGLVGPWSAAVMLDNDGGFGSVFVACLLVTVLALILLIGLMKTNPSCRIS